MNWWTDEARFVSAVMQHGTPTQAARVEGGISERRAREIAKEIPALSAPSSEPGQIAAAEIDVPPESKWSDESLLKDAGLDPSEWIVTGSKPGRHEALAPEGEVVQLNRLSITAQRRVPVDCVLPARADGWKPARPEGKPRVTRSLIAVVSDTHAPYHDEGLDSCFNQWLARHKPERAYDLGDLLDLPTPSRHRTTRGLEATPQECIDERYRIDARRVAASPGTAWSVLIGNHDERIDHAIRDKIGAHVARIARAGDDLPVMDLGFLLRYDELGVELLRPDGDYHSITAKIVDGLNARHGTKAGAYGGATKAMVRRNASLLSGHDHKQVYQQHVNYDQDESALVTISVSIGAMCRRDLGYVEDPDVAQGFATVVDHGDGVFHVELAKYDDARGTLTWRDELYRA